MRYSIVFTAALAASVQAHGVITQVQGANGVNMPGLSVADGTPRDSGNPLSGSEADTSIIRAKEMGGKASALGRTASGPVDAGAAIAKFMGAVPVPVLLVLLALVLLVLVLLVLVLVLVLLVLVPQKLLVLVPAVLLLAVPVALLEVSVLSLVASAATSVVFSMPSPAELVALAVQVQAPRHPRALPNRASLPPLAPVRPLVFPPPPTTAQSP